MSGLIEQSPKRTRFAGDPGLGEFVEDQFLAGGRFVGDPGLGSDTRALLDMNNASTSWSDTVSPVAWWQGQSDSRKYLLMAAAAAVVYYFVKKR